MVETVGGTPPKIIASKVNPLESRLILLKNWEKYHEWPSLGGLRHLAFFRKENGFDDAFVKSGKTLFIDEIPFFTAVRKRAKNKG